MDRSVQFRNGLTARKLTWAVGIPRQLRFYPAGVRMIWPVARRGLSSSINSLPDTPGSRG